MEAKLAWMDRVLAESQLIPADAIRLGREISKRATKNQARRSSTKGSSS